MAPRLIAVWWAACLLWSFTFLFIRIGLGEVPPFTFAWLRLGVALAVLTPIAMVRGDMRDLTRPDIVRIATAGLLLLGVNYALLFWGAQFIPSGLVAILQSATPVVALAFGAALGSERVTFRKIVALVLAIGGVVIIFGSEARASGLTAITGSAAAFGGSVCVAAAYVWVKQYGRRLPPLTITTLQSAAAIVPLACVAFIVEGPPAVTRWSLPAWGALAYLGFGASVVAFWLNYWLLARMDASAMLMMGIAEVPIAIGLGAVLLGERLPTGTLTGAAAVIGGVIVVLLDQSAMARGQAKDRAV